MLESLRKLSPALLELPRFVKRLLVLCVDASLCVLTVWLAFFLRVGEFAPLSGPLFWAAIASLVIATPIFIVTGLYRAIFRYSGWPVQIAIVKAVMIYGLIYASIFTAVGIQGVPRTVGIIQPILLALGVMASRALARFLLSEMYQNELKRADLPKALIYGAGSAGRQLAAALANSPDMNVVGFLDDDDRLHGHVLAGLKIYAPEELPKLVPTLGVTDVLLAIPSLSRKQSSEILKTMQASKVAVRTLPRVADIAQGKVTVADLRELEIEDLLGRDPIAPNHILLSKNIINQVVMVTGAGGSIGSELCRQIIQVRPSVLLLVEQSEFALYSICEELSALPAVQSANITLIPLLASVRDEHRMRDIVTTWKPHTIYHAAAYKHVPLVEHNPVEGLMNNVFGTQVTAQIAAEEKIANFVLISTDKAVRPTNIMGASKRLAEMLVQAMAETTSKTMFSMVRFGNVLGSSGSVIPKFRQQIKEGGPITVTHEDITRYFMTIPEAAQLVIQAGAMARQGDVFVLDMGEPVRIMEMAERMIELSGLSVRNDTNPDGDIEIEVVGLRPGEKLYEELLIGDNPMPTAHPRIMQAHEDSLPWLQLQQKLDELQAAMDRNDVKTIRALLQQLVSGYTPTSGIVDWVHLEQTTAS